MTMLIDTLFGKVVHAALELESELETELEETEPKHEAGMETEPRQASEGDLELESEPALVSGPGLESDPEPAEERLSELGSEPASESSCRSRMLSWTRSLWAESPE